MDGFMELLEKIDNAPFDIKAYPAYVQLCEKQDTDAATGSKPPADSLDDEESDDEANAVPGPLATDARMTMVQALAATDAVWLPLLRNKIATLDALSKPEDANTLLQLFRNARNDYLSIPLLKLQVNAVVGLSNRSRGINDLWNDETVREILREIVEQGSQHISKSYQVWNPWLEWELERLGQLSGEAEKHAYILQLDDLFLERLKQVHSNYAATMDLYSPFVSTYFSPEEYESKLIHATKTRELPLKQLSWREGNPKRVREALELRAEAGGLTEWKQYLNWELKAKKPQRKLILGVYERALECAARARWASLSNKQQPKGQATESDPQKDLIELWEEYLNYVAQTSDKSEEHRTFLLNLARRATRCVPESGSIWAMYMRLVEKVTTPPTEGSDADMQEDEIFTWEEGIDDIYTRLMAMNLIQRSLDDLVSVILTRASWSRRQCFGEEAGEQVIDQDQMADVIQIVETGLASVRALEGGDVKMRLEGFLSAFYMSLPLYESAAEVLQGACKFYKTSYLAWLNYIDLLIFQRQIAPARNAFKDASQRKGLDWPEVIWERWVSFEYQYGTLEDIEKATGAVKEFKKLEDARRKKAWDAHIQAQAAAYDTSAASTGNAMVQPQTHRQAHAHSSANGIAATNVGEETGMEVDPQLSPSHKRKRSVNGEMDASPTPKRTKHDTVAAATSEQATTSVNDEETVLKRDRERTSVLVSKLPQEAITDDIKRLFKDCGDIREIQLKSLPNENVATVEFTDRNSIPIAMTRDKKRVKGAEVVVSTAEKTTLHVTNFREGMDDKEIRAMFEKFGTILDVRWPSKRIKTTRRFCYVQFTSTAAARDALYLNGFEVEPGMRMRVLISDPTKKNERSDAGARELRVTGVARSVQREDLDNLFSLYGPLKDIRLLPAMGGNQTAFVEFESEDSAQKALVANNQMLKGRRLAVTMADARPNRVGQDPASREDIINRSIRIKNVPEGTAEPILQQALVKIAPVVRVQLLPQSHEATIELASLPDAGKLLLEHPTIQFEGHTLTLTEESRVVAAPSRNRGAGGRGRGRGSNRGGGTATSNSHMQSSAKAPESQTSASATAASRGTLGNRGGRGGRGSRLGLGMKATGDRERPELSGESGAGGSAAASTTTGAAKSQADFRKMFGL